MQNFTFILKKKRMQMGLTQGELSNRLGIAKSTYSQYEAGKRRPSTSMLAHIAMELNTTMDELMGLYTVTKRDLAFLEYYHRLPQENQETIEKLLKGLAVKTKENKVFIDCYRPAKGNKKKAEDKFMVERMIVKANRQASCCDFCVEIEEGELFSFFPRGTFIGAKAVAPSHNELGVFLLNGFLYTRIFYQKEGIKKLVSPNLDISDIFIQPRDKFVPLGRAVGILERAED